MMAALQPLGTPLIRHPASFPACAFAAKLDDARAADRIAAVPARAIRIRTVPRAAVEALVARLTAQGVPHAG